MTQIEAHAVIPGSVHAVWAAVVEPERWSEWSDHSGAVHLEAVEIVAGDHRHVGDWRRCTATLGGFPLLRRRRVEWDEQITDATPGHTLEVQAAITRGGLRRWRVRLWLVEQPDGQTRAYCRLTYSPATALMWLADVVYLRRQLTSAAAAWLGGLAGAFIASIEAIDQDVETSGRRLDAAPSEEASRHDTERAAA